MVLQHATLAGFTYVKLVEHIDAKCRVVPRHRARANDMVVEAISGAKRGMMNEYGRAAGALERFNRCDAAHAAEAIQRDFRNLIAIFDHQLGSLPHELPAQSHISEAKRTAERGLELVEDLVELLRTSR